MAEWIGDGYDSNCSIEGYRFEYRPLPQHLRVAVAKRYLERGPQDKKELRRAIRERLIDCVIPMEKQEDDQFLGLLWQHVCGFKDRGELQEETINLKMSLAVKLKNPQFDKFSCEQCKTWWIDIDSGKVTRTGDERAAVRRDGPPPCDNGAVCPVGHFDRQRRLSERNKYVLLHFQECDTVGEFPDDPIVRFNAATIRNAMKNAGVNTVSV